MVFNENPKYLITTVRSNDDDIVKYLSHLIKLAVGSKRLEYIKYFYINC